MSTTMQRSRHPARRSKHSKGFSLVELLVAMTIGLILVSGMIAVFSGNKRSSDLNSAMANIQESARFAINTIAADIRMAGYQGCIDINRQSVISQAANAPVIGNRLSSTVTTGALVNADRTWTPDSPVGFAPPAANQAVPGTHTLMLQFGQASEQVGLSGQMESGGVPSLAGPLPLTDNINGVTAGDFVIVANCEAGDLFQVTGLQAGGLQLLHAAGANRSGNLQQVYGNTRTRNQTSAMKFESNIYYIGETGLSNQDGSAITSLFQQGLPYDPDDNPPTELIQGVENLRVAFGIRNNGGNLSYVTPDSPQFNPRNVEAIQIGLLMSSWESIAEDDDNSTYMLAGQAIVPAGAEAAAGATTHPADRRFRLAFNTTIKVRNRRNRN